MDIHKLHSKQQAFFNSNQTLDIDFRITQLKKLKKVLKENEESLYKAIYEDFGKSAFETYISELSLVYHEINIFLKNIKRWSRRVKVSSRIVNFPARSYIITEPLGITLVIGAWNYPFQLSLVPAITSLAAGNTVILKPSELPARSSKVMAEIINGNFPDEYFSVVEGGARQTTELLKYRFDKLFFTGSVHVGKIVYAAAARHLTPVTLELGGKSPTFVLADCDIKISAKRIVWAKFLNAGQTCVAPDYVLVDKSVEEKFLEAVRNEIEKYYHINGSPGENYLRIIDLAHFDRLTNLIDKEKIYCGGYASRENLLIDPTILNNVSFDDEVMKEEIFGPVLPVITFENPDEAIRKVKERPRPLACYVYSKNRKLINRILREVSFGGGAVNDSVMHFANSNLPFGGIGLSGMGSYHGKAGFDTFSHHKSILDKSYWLEPPLKYPPYSKRKLKVIKWLFE
jgi:aldehyde dehydrogenase (NAD+)